MYELLAGLAKSALKVGDRPRSIVLGNARGKAKDVGQMVKRKPVLVMLYRDGWCPFYNLEPHAFQRVPPEIKAADAALVAISLEKPDNTLTPAEKNALSFEVLCNIGQKIVRI